MERAVEFGEGVDLALAETVLDLLEAIEPPLVEKMALIAAVGGGHITNSSQQHVQVVGQIIRTAEHLGNVIEIGFRVPAARLRRAEEAKGTAGQEIASRASAAIRGIEAVRPDELS